jgi:hypothetical protein
VFLIDPAIALISLEETGYATVVKRQRRRTMATVTVLKFPSVEGAQNALSRVQDLHKQHLIKVHDAAIVSWPVGK